MKFVFLMDPIESINQDRDSTFVLMLESQRRSHQVLIGHPRDLVAWHDRPAALLAETKLQRGSPHFESHPPSTVYLDEVDAVFMRKDPPFDMSYVFSTYMLDLLDRTTLVINDPVGIKRANEKMYALRFPDLVPRTLVTRNKQLLKSFLHDLGGQMILKPWDGNGGRGVLLVAQEDRNLNSLLEISTLDETQYVIAQQYVPQARLGDKRIILVDGHPVGAILRVPAENEHRGNIHVGATVLKSSLTARDLKICAQIGPSLQEDGLLFVGIDVLGDFLTEINVTSPTGIQELDALDGLCVEANIIDRVEMHVASGHKTLRIQKGSA